MPKTPELPQENIMPPEIINERVAILDRSRNARAVLIEEIQKERTEAMRPADLQAFELV